MGSEKTLVDDEAILMGGDRALVDIAAMLKDTENGLAGCVDWWWKGSPRYKGVEGW